MNYLYEESDLLKYPFQCFYMGSDDKYFPVAPHWHYYMEMLYILEGEAMVHASGVDYEVSKGDVVLLFPRSIHSIYNPKNTKLCYAVIKLDLNTMTVSSSYSPKIRSIFKCAEKQNAEVVIKAPVAADMRIEYIFHRCIYEMNTQNYGYDMIIRSELYKLTIMVIRFWQDRGFTIDNEAFAEDATYDIYNITQYIDKHMGKDLKVTDIADFCGMSYSYFAKKFQKIYGKSCKEYIEQMRVYKAEELLVFTDFDLTEISLATGFSDCSHLIKSFKKYRGVTPKQFRMAHAYEPKNIKKLSWNDEIMNVSSFY